MGKGRVKAGIMMRAVCDSSLVELTTSTHRCGLGATWDPYREGSQCGWSGLLPQ